MMYPGAWCVGEVGGTKNMARKEQAGDKQEQAGREGEGAIGRTFHVQYLTLNPDKDII